jgi:CDP-diacylglycerol--glycerol-3-phosphate 3-phosphatidyltransferase
MRDRRPRAGGYRTAQRDREQGMDISASRLGKLKTGFQIAAIIPLMIHYPLFGLDAQGIGQILLWLALGFTVWSGADYFAKFKLV